MKNSTFGQNIAKYDQKLEKWSKSAKSIFETNRQKPVCILSSFSLFTFFVDIRQVSGVLS